MLNPHQLQIFLAVAECDSYSRAAERLGISQPAVSMQVSRLEKAVGLPLLLLRGRQISLTEAGETLLRHARRILEAQEAADLALAELKGLRRGRLRLAASSTPGAYLLPRVIAAFQQAHPGLEIRLQISNTLSALQAVQEGLSDLAVVGEPPEAGPELLIEPLARDFLAVVVWPGHRWAGGGPVAAGDLATEALVLREPGSSTRAVLERRLRSLGLKVQPALELGSTEAVREAVAAGLGATVISRLAVRTDLESGRLVAVPVSDLPLERMLHTALPGGGARSQATSAFLAQLRSGDYS